MEIVKDKFILVVTALLVLVLIGGLGLVCVEYFYDTYRVRIFIETEKEIEKIELELYDEIEVIQSPSQGAMTKRNFKCESDGLYTITVTFKDGAVIGSSMYVTGGPSGRYVKYIITDDDVVYKHD